MISPTGVDELVRLLRIYVTYGPALQQMLGDLERSKAAELDPDLRRLFRRLRERAGQTGGA